MSSVWLSLVVIPLVLTELSGWAAWLVTKAARRAARRLGEPDVEVRYAEGATATIVAVPGPLTQVVAAVGIVARPALRRVLHAMPAAPTPGRDIPPHKRRP